MVKTNCLGSICLLDCIHKNISLDESPQSSDNNWFASIMISSLISLFHNFCINDRFELEQKRTASSSIPS